MNKLRTLRKSFYPIELSRGDGNALFLNNEMVQNKDGLIIPEGDGFINVTYTSKHHLSRILSNLFPYEIHFRNQKAASIEGILQGIKHSEPEIQKLVMKYSGIDAFHTRGSTRFSDWRDTQKLFWEQQEMKRDSEQYQNFLDELYLSAAQNPLYAKALKSTFNKTLIHSNGNTDPKETVLTRNEYESRLNSLRDLIVNNHKF